MDTLPKIGIVPEGIDTFFKVLGCLQYFGVTLRTRDGEVNGFLAGNDWQNDVAGINVTVVDDEWEGTGDITFVPVEDIDELLVH